MSTDPVPLVPEMESASADNSVSKLFQVIGWFSAGVVVAAFSIYLGAELRSRYLFKKRTPYDFYSNVSEQPTGEFGVGI